MNRPQNIMRCLAVLFATFSIFFLASLSAPQAAHAQAAGKGNVDGTVVDAAGAPVKGARVVIFYMHFARIGNSGGAFGASNEAETMQQKRVVRTLTSDDNGKFKIENIDPREYRYDGSNPTVGYAEGKFTVEAGKTVKLEIKLTK